ncbi:uncharacterized protein DFL_008925 [Arthrobotrys flagrans]|uniref:Uncharacterized protein n=1 Tax=Arthrobotrys flagrans TaxID=97331 RepID=A0A436ZQ60_ARTFL|nr:hypothetical protein DFL_008925 [Arthrobotrys flagrans]
MEALAGEGALPTDNSNNNYNNQKSNTNGHQPGSQYRSHFRRSGLSAFTVSRKQTSQKLPPENRPDLSSNASPAARKSVILVLVLVAKFLVTITSNHQGYLWRWRINGPKPSKNRNKFAGAPVVSNPDWSRLPNNQRQPPLPNN